VYVAHIIYQVDFLITLQVGSSGKTCIRRI